MKQKPKKVKYYSIEELDSLINRIRAGILNEKEATDEAISKKAGYGEGYIAQTRSRGKASQKLMNILQLTYKNELQNATQNQAIKDVDSFLINKIIKQDAMLETILEVLAEQEASRTSQPITKLLSEYRKAIANRQEGLWDEVKQIGE